MARIKALTGFAVDAIDNDEMVALMAHNLIR